MMIDDTDRDSRGSSNVGDGWVGRDLLVVARRSNAHLQRVPNPAEKDSYLNFQIIFQIFKYSDSVTPQDHALLLFRLVESKSFVRKHEAAAGLLRKTGGCDTPSNTTQYRSPLTVRSSPIKHPSIQQAIIFVG